MTEKVDRSNLKRFVLTLPWALTRFCGRIVRRFFVALGVLAALIVVGYVEFESIVEAIDAFHRERFASVQSGAALGAAAR